MKTNASSEPAPNSPTPLPLAIPLKKQPGNLPSPLSWPSSPTRKRVGPFPEPTAIKEYSGQLRLRLPRSLHGHLAARAATEGVSINTLIVAAVAAALAQKETAEQYPAVSQK